MKEFPAEHYMVIIFDHGQGWRGINPDDKDIGAISPEDLGRITEKVKKETGKNIDLMVMENCLEGQAESLYPMRNSTDYIVASPEVLWGSAYTDIPGPIHIREGLELMQKLHLKIDGENIKKLEEKLPEEKVEIIKKSFSNKKFREEELAGKLKEADFNEEEIKTVIACAGKYSSLDNPALAALDLIQATAGKDHAITLSAIDSKKLDGIAESTKKLKESLLKAGISGEKLKEVAGKTQHYELLDPVELRHGYLDMEDFAENIEKTVDDAEVKAAAKGLKDSVEGAVVSEYHTQGDEIWCKSDDGDGWISFEANVKRSHGLAMNFGIPGNDREKELYKNLSFNIATGWDEVVNKAEWDIRESR